MGKVKLFSISLICLSVSLIISSILIANGLKKSSEYIATSISNSYIGISNVLNSQSQQASQRGNLPEGNDLMTTNEVADYLGIQLNVLHDAMNDKSLNIPYVKIGDKYIFSRKAIDNWLQTRVSNN